MISGGKFHTIDAKENKYVLAFDFINASKAFVQVWILDLQASGLRSTLTPQYQESDDINLDAAVYYFSPYEKISIPFDLNEMSYSILKDTNCEFKLYLVNSLGEKFSEDIKFTSSVKEHGNFSVSVMSYKTMPLK